MFIMHVSQKREKKQIQHYCNVNEARFKDGMHNKRFFSVNHYTLAHTERRSLYNYNGVICTFCI